MSWKDDPVVSSGWQDDPVVEDKKRRTVTEELARQGGLGVRDIVSGLMSVPNIIGDAANTAINYGIRGVNAVGGTSIPTLGLPSDATQSLMTRGGLPEPESGAEKFASSVNRAVTGFGPWVKGAQLASEAAQKTPLLASILSKPVAETAAVATGAAASEGAKDAGLGPAWQLAAGAVAPMGVNAVGAVAGHAGRTVKEALRPVTRAGSEQIAADVLGRLTQDKTAALSNLRQFNETPNVGVPGSRPLAAAVSGDYGLVGGHQTFARGDNAAAVAVRQAENNAARLEDLSKLNATEKVVEAYKAKRDAITAPMREQVFGNAQGPVDYGRVDGLIVALRNSSAGGKQETARALDTLRGWVQERAKSGRNSPEDAYALHQDINDLIRGRIQDQQGSIRLSAGMATAVKRELADVIEESAPGFKKYLEHYSRLSRPIERLETITERLGGQDLSRVTTSLPSAAPAGGPQFTLSQHQMRGAVRDLERDTNLALRQRDILNRVAGELNADTFAARGGKQPGSDTYQNMASANFVRRMLGDTLAESGVGKLVQGPLNIVHKPLEGRVSDAIARAYLDPKEMERLLRMARTSRGGLTIAGLLGHGRDTSTAGLLGSLLQ